MNAIDYILVLVIVAATAYYFSSVKPKPIPRKLAPKKKQKSFLDFVQQTGDDMHVILYYASQTGTAQDLAARFAKEVHTSLRIKTLLCDIEDYDMTALFNVSPLRTIHVFFLATYGEGEPTDSSDKFYTQIFGSDVAGRIECDGSSYPVSSPLTDTVEVETSPLAHLKFAVFGLGNSTYQYFNAISKRTSARLTKLGGHSLSDGLGDDFKDLEGDYLRWKVPTIEAIALSLDIPIHGIDLTLPHSKLYSHSFSLMPQTKTEGVIGNGSGTTKNPHYCRVTRRDELFRDSHDAVNGLSLERQCYHIEIELLKKMRFTTGDHVGVFPRHAPTDTLRMLQSIVEQDVNGDKCGFTESEWDMQVTFEAVEDATSQNAGLGFPPCTPRTLFTHFLDFKAVVKQDSFLVLSKYSSDPRLLEIFKMREVYSREIEARGMDLCDCIEEYGIEIGLDVAVEVLGRIQPRYYSISSSSVVTPASLAITAMWVHYSSQTPAKTIIRKGLTTTFLKECVVGDVIPVTLRKSHFRLAKFDVPIIMIGPGTGVAPFRGFLHERYLQSTNSDIASTLLFYGCRNEKEHMYAEEFSEFTSCSQIKISCGYSRSSMHIKRYVQDIVREQLDAVREIVEGGGVVYVCGDGARMSVDVWRCFGEMFGVDRMEGMRKDGRYLEDVWS